MYYLLNENKQIIAADDDLLNLCNVNHIHDLCTKTMQGEIHFDIDSEVRLTLSYAEEKDIYEITTTPFSSLLGTMTLVTLLNKEEESISEEKYSLAETNLAEEETDLQDFILDEEAVASPLADKENNTEEIDNPENLLISLDDGTAEAKDTHTLEENKVEVDEDALFDLAPDDQSSEEEEEKTTDSDEINKSDTDDAALYNLTLDDHLSEEAVANISEVNKAESDDTASSDFTLDDQSSEEKEKPEDETQKEDVDSPIYIDINDISQKIGISPEDYNTFLNEFIDTSLDLEKDLQSQNIEKKESAVHTLSQLSEILYLPMVSETLIAITKGDDDTQQGAVASYFTTLSRITTETQDSVKSEKDIVQEESLEILEISENIEETLSQDDKTPETKHEHTESFGEISLDDIQPKHFDFQLEEAANDLSLPVELIEEFVHDFIEQSHIETKKMLESYQEGDLESIQKIGHLLKGASSNLRINELSNTLYKIQFCEDSSQLESLIKDYWAHFLSFEHQIKMLSN